ncbi:ATP-grasp domain-containing protein [Pantoea sp. Z09]|uniref:ATP-grasp domain-containing protein n=1 Tax=Pantoea sp. Z09 TaxID=2886821 RepID=UPI001EFEC053|nr:ATP-grasp domain-containing protein [Pantoea sp. Z09]
MKRVAIIDGFSSGKFVAKSLYNRNCELIHISSSAQLDSYYYKGFEEGIYRLSIIHDCLEKSLEILKKFNAEFIIAGSESGVALADLLNKELLLSYRNDFESASCRRNKFDMIEAIRAAGLNAVAQVCISEWREASNWLHNRNYPVVLKPLTSAGSDNVFICQNEDEVHLAFNKTKNQINKLNLINEYVLIQDFMQGVEYVVNFVSLDGNFLVTEVVRYYKRKLKSGNVIYDIDELIDSSAEEFETLVDYTKRVCIALGIKNGPSHAEVMLTKDGPCLVEIAARSDGILRPDICFSTTGLGQLEATVLSVVDPQKFLSLTREPFYRLKNFSFNVGLISPGQGIFSDVALIEHSKKLPSYKSIELYLSSGEHVTKTKDVFSQPGTIYLVSPDKAQLWEDYKKIRDFEKSGIYFI